MKKEQLIETLHSALFNRDIRKHLEVKDFYRMIDYADLTNLSKDEITKSIKVFKWVTKNPNYNFNQLFENYYLEKHGYTNDELYSYFKLYLENLELSLDKYIKNEFVIRFSDFENN